MTWLVDISPIPSAMEHGAPCSIGETIEAALRIPASSNRIDLLLDDAIVEMKSDRIEASTPKSEATTTLRSVDGQHFTGPSDTDRYRQFVTKYGYYNHGNRIATRCFDGEQRPIKKGKNYLSRINLYHKITQDPNHITDLFGEYYSNEDRIWICHPDDGRLLFIDQESIDEVKDKYTLQYCPHANEILIDGRIHFDIISVDALTTKLYPMTVRRFWKAILDGEQILEFRAHICDDIYCPSKASPQCKPPGGLRCRGTAFRTPKPMMSMIWYIENVA